MENNTNPRVVNSLKALAFSLQCRIQLFQKFFAALLFALFLGFLLANIFGTFLGVLRSVAAWDGFVILGLIVVIEMISCATYRTVEKPVVGNVPRQSIGGPGIFWRLINNFKIGLLLGFFVEAFKVGS